MQYVKRSVLSMKSHPELNEKWLQAQIVEYPEMQRKRRANGEGTIFFDNSRNRWVAQISLPDGRRNKASTLTQKDALLKLAEMQDDLKNHGADSDGRR